MPSHSQRERLADSFAAYQAAMRGSAAAGFVKSRGINPDAFAAGVLGFSAAGIARKDHPANRLVICYTTRAGIVDLKFRALDDSDPKYLYAPGTVHRLWNVEALRANEGAVVLTEGELDALIVQQHTGIPACAYPGVSAFKPYMARAFAGLDEVIVVADGDRPGREAAKTVSSEIGRFADRVRVVRMPDGEDANSFFLAHGADQLKGLLSE